MDPDACLKRMRELAAGAVLLADYKELAEHVLALDSWISNGGFLPAAWAKPARPPARIYARPDGE